MSYDFLPSSISLFKFEESQNKKYSIKIEGFINHEELVQKLTKKKTEWNEDNQQWQKNAIASPSGDPTVGSRTPISSIPPNLTHVGRFSKKCTGKNCIYRLPHTPKS